MGAVTVRGGALLWSAGSQRCRHWTRYIDDLKKEIGADGTNGTTSGWISDDLARHFEKTDEKDFDAAHRVWCTADFEVGDVAIFGLNLVHQTLRNETHCFRLSCDTRWQPICQRIDHRLKAT